MPYMILFWRGLLTSDELELRNIFSIHFPGNLDVAKRGLKLLCRRFYFKLGTSADYHYQGAAAKTFLPILKASKSESKLVYKIV